MKTIEMIINEIKENEALQQKLMQAAKGNALDAFLKELGCEASVEEFIECLKKPQGELSDDDLDAVAGGARWEEALISIFGFGYGCAIVAIQSAFGTEEGINKENREAGSLLCNWK